MSWRRHIPATVITSFVAPLDSAGGSARLVGGTVRDALLGRTPYDFDIATSLRPGTVLLRLPQLPTYSAYVENRQHGTISFRHHGQTITIASLRRDVATDGRRARIVYVTDWRQDAQRRDFTINALYGAANGAIEDPLGCGLDDLSAGRVRFIGTPRRRIQEDYLRILRFFRFFAHFAKTDIDAEGYAAAKAEASEVGGLPAIYRRKELLRLLTGPRATQAVAHMQAAGVLAAMLGDTVPVSALSEDLSQLAADRPERALLELIPACPAAMERIAARLELSKRQKAYLFAARGLNRRS